MLLADEPTGSLDSPETRGGPVIRLLLAVAREHGAAVVLVTHDPSIAAYASRVVTLHSGHLDTGRRHAHAGGCRLMWWLFTRLVRRPLRRILLGAVGVAFPVALLGAMLLFVDVAVQSMTAVALSDVQVEMRALASSLTVDMAAADAQILTVPGVHGVDRFASADVVVSADGAAPRRPPDCLPWTPRTPRTIPR